MCVGAIRSSLFIANGAVGTDTAFSTEDTWSRGGGIMLRGADFSVEDVGCMHIMADGRIVKSGGPELALEVETNGYADILNEVA